ncbi:hypothetical protein FTV88_0126 [Heliorestis convoluta]|uniref:Uncharacterized protein n=1 Tax=Heliorestis convoluta TaxID=356322 RepID=A0A5Q2N180_9FIRM|nr:hypothetical protein FTV88_0126 [Heliorestis convoluta]
MFFHVHGVIVNCRGMHFGNWVQLPSQKALLGYINYIFSIGLSPLKFSI